MLHCLFQLIIPVTHDDWGWESEIMLHVYKFGHSQLLGYLEILVELLWLPIAKDMWGLYSHFIFNFTTK